MRIKIERVKPVALPSRHFRGDSGMDVVNAGESFVLKTLERRLVPTGLKVEIPEGFEIQIRPRSGLAAKKGITVLNAPGTVDASYRGEIMVILVNLGVGEVKIAKGDRIAQMVLSKVEKIEWKESRKLKKTLRGSRGFGSTDEKTK